MVTAFDTGEVSDIAAVVHSTYLDHQGLPGQQPVTGTDGFVQVVETARRGFTQLSVTIEDMIENGDRVAARLRWNGVTTSGERSQRETIDIIVVRGGQAIEHWGARS